MLFSYLCNKISFGSAVSRLVKLRFPVLPLHSPCIIFVIIIDINSLQAAGIPAANTNGTYY